MQLRKMLNAILRAGGSVNVDATTGVATATFAREDYDDGDWREGD